MLNRLLMIFFAFALVACAPKNPNLTDENVKYYCLRKPKACSASGQPRLPGFVESNEKQRYERLVALRARQAELKATATPATVNGEPVLIARSADKQTVSVFGTRPRQGASLRAIENDVAKATGCEVRLKLGVLASASGFSKSTSMALQQDRGLKLQTYCDGDQRTRTKAAPSSVVLREDGEVPFPEYPEADVTWLYYSGPHGFQVTYLGADGVSWLWYPGNNAAVPATWRKSADDEVCFTYGQKTFNPVTKRSGGKEECAAAELTQRLLISKLSGDPFDLSSGRVPYQRTKCVAPEDFRFDRTRFSCD